ncbi:MAG TPA: DinB family protein [Vicinamibacterales bacterium]|nr:DinB family protein [Vicinamibacterales bacterium]
MTYYGGKDLARQFRTVRANTIKLAEEIPDNKFDFRPAPDTRSVGQTLTHIAVGTGFQYHVHSNKISDMTTVNFPELFQKISAEEAKPRSKAEIIALLKSEGDKFAAFLESLPESFLAESVKLPPQAGEPSRTRFEMLLSPKEHEMHHRGQLMTMQRMIGQVPHLTRQMQERMAQMQAGAQAQR